MKIIHKHLTTNTDTDTDTDTIARSRSRSSTRVTTITTTTTSSSSHFQPYSYCASSIIRIIVNFSFILVVLFIFCSSESETHIHTKTSSLSLSLPLTSTSPSPLFASAFVIHNPHLHPHLHPSNRHLNRHTSATTLLRESTNANDTMIMKPSTTNGNEHEHVHEHEHEKDHDNSLVEDQAKNRNMDMSMGMGMGMGIDMDGMIQLHHRLQKCNVSNYFFARDDNPTHDQYGPGPGPGPGQHDNDNDIHQARAMTLQKLEGRQLQDPHDAVHVKTLIWKGTYLHNTTEVLVPHTSITSTTSTRTHSDEHDVEKNEHDEKKDEDEDENENNKDNEDNEDSFYVVTALRVNDKVDMRKLRDIVRREYSPQQQPQPQQSTQSNTGPGTLLLSLAPLHVAESYTGYKSGSMPPGWHTRPMKLLIDDGILKEGNYRNAAGKSGSGGGGGSTTSTTRTGGTMMDANVNVDGLEALHQRVNDQCHDIMISVGSGAENYSLHVSLLDTITSSVYVEDNREKATEDLDHRDRDHDHDHDDETPGHIFGCERYICSIAKDVKKKRKKKSTSSTSTSTSTTSTESWNGSNYNNQNVVVVDDDNDGAITETDPNRTEPIEITRKLFHVTARTKGHANQIRQMIDAMGDSFPSFMKVLDNSGANVNGNGNDANADDDNNNHANNDNRHFGIHQKNALHYAAWKGDLETMTVLMDACRPYQEQIGGGGEGRVDVVNVISTGEGNYGKTPIFYAITQCRDDAVLHLCTHGASLLIVNNKGQTPCSLSINKLKPSTCRIMCQMEQQQLAAGGTFVNYRMTHSDGKRYGDLDPRFIGPGDINFDDKVQRELDQYRAYRRLMEEEEEEEQEEEEDGENAEIGSERQRILDEYPFFENCLPDKSLPRSIKVTTPIWRQEQWLKKKKEKEEQLKAEQEENMTNTNGVENSVSEVDKDENTPDPESDGNVLFTLSKNGNERFSKRENRNGRKGSNSLASSNHIKLLDGTVIDMTLLQTLSLEDVLSSNTDGTQVTYELVDDAAGITALDFAIDETLERTRGDNYEKNDEDMIGASWGLDCEWRPKSLLSQKEESPVATLQLSSNNRAFVVDIQSICQGGVKDATAAMTPIETELNEALAKLFSRKEIPIIGFGIPQDLGKLAASFPHMSCFQMFHSVVDLQPLSRVVYPKTPKSFMTSLQKAVAILLRKRLDKTEQCSEWNIRPLRPSQLEYASLDATVLPILLQNMLQDNPIVQREDGFFLRKQYNMYSSYRFTFLNTDDEQAYRAAMGSIKTTMRLRIARQVWPTHKKDPPPSPEPVPMYELSTKEESDRSKVKAERDKKKYLMKKKRKPVELTLLTGDLHGLPRPGLELGYTKESCIHMVLREEVIRSLPEHSYLRFNRRGGVIEVGNAWLLFVNFGVGRAHHKYRNEFLDEGRRLTFTINPSRYEDSQLLQNLLIPDHSSMFRKSVLLFIRGSTKEKFIFCGDCRCASHTERNDSLVNLVLELNQYEDLIMGSSDRDDSHSTYMRIVSDQNLHEYED